MVSRANVAAVGSPRLAMDTVAASGSGWVGAVGSAFPAMLSNASEAKHSFNGDGVEFAPRFFQVAEAPAEIQDGGVARHLNRVVGELVALTFSAITSLSLAIWRFLAQDPGNGMVLIGVFLVALIALGVAILANRS